MPTLIAFVRRFNNWLGNCELNAIIRVLVVMVCLMPIWYSIGFGLQAIGTYATPRDPLLSLLSGEKVRATIFFATLWLPAGWLHLAGLWGREICRRMDIQSLKHCAHCGYDLSVLASEKIRICPECGAPFEIGEVAVASAVDAAAVGRREMAIQQLTNRVRFGWSVLMVAGLVMPLIGMVFLGASGMTVVSPNLARLSGIYLGSPMNCVVLSVGLVLMTFQVFHTLYCRRIANAFTALLRSQP